MIAVDATPTRRVGTFSRRSGDTTLLESYRDAYELNVTGAFIWSLVTGDRTVGEIAMALAREFDIDRETSESVVTDFIDALIQSKFVVVHE